VCLRRTIGKLLAQATNATGSSGGWKTVVTSIATALLAAIFALVGSLLINSTQFESERANAIRLASVAAYGEATAAAIEYASLRDNPEATTAEANNALSDWRIAFQIAFAYGLTETDTQILANIGTINMQVLNFDEEPDAAVAFKNVSSAVLNLNVRLCKKLDPTANCLLTD